jgi:hypothetical protein
MNRKLNLGLSIAAGLLGGFLSHYVSPALVHAQTPSAPPKQIAAQSFWLVNDQGVPSGVFGFEKDGSPSIKLFDKSGKVIWMENGKPQVLPREASLSK